MPQPSRNPRSPCDSRESPTPPARSRNSPTSPAHPRPPRIVTPGQTLEYSPISTSPITYANSLTQAVSAIRGVFPPKLLINALLLSDYPTCSPRNPPPPPSSSGCRIIKRQYRPCRNHPRNNEKPALITVIVRHESRYHRPDHHPQHHNHLREPVDDGEVLPPEVVPPHRRDNRPARPPRKPVDHRVQHKQPVPRRRRQNHHRHPVPQQAQRRECAASSTCLPEIPPTAGTASSPAKAPSPLRRPRFRQAQVRLHVRHLVHPRRRDGHQRQRVTYRNYPERPRAQSLPPRIILIRRRSKYAPGPILR